MELQFFGANCIKIANKKIAIVIDDNRAQYGLKPVAAAKDVVLSTSNMPAPAESHFFIDSPGEYEVSDISIQGIAARSHMDEAGKMSAVMYRIIMDGYRIAVVGHIHPDLTDWQMEALGTVDIMFIPVGGNGYTLDGIGAHKVVKEIEPHIVVPTHYEDAKFNFEVPQTPLEDAIKAMAMEPVDRLESLKLKNFEIGEGTRLIVLNRQ